MSTLNAILLAEARQTGRGVRSTHYRHRRLVRHPMAMVLWQLGAEPFTAAAVAWGSEADTFDLACPGEPRNRDLAFRALTRVAKEFNPWFEGGHGGEPQVVVPNAGNLELLRRLGRRLAYLPTDGPNPADPALVRFGQHLRFLADHALMPGQQLVVVLTDLLRTHWVTELSDLETQSLPALAAAIAPPPGMSGHAAAAAAELTGVGPLPAGEDDDLAPLLEAFNEARNGRVQEKVVAPLRVPIEAHYRALVERSWPLIWRAVEREQAQPEAPSVQRRWNRDLESLGRHFEHVDFRDGRRRTRQTHAQAARTLGDWEDQQRLLEAEEALDDRMKMIPELLADRALFGRVVEVDLSNKRSEAGTSKVKRPLVTIETDLSCLIPPGKELWWTGDADGKPYILVESVQVPGANRWRVVLCHQVGSDRPRPEASESATFSVHHLAPPYFIQLPRQVPWTHATKLPPIEDAAEEPGHE